ncbi:ribonuclease T2 [Rhodoblastus sp.]|uniref:ribonuclease T2 n=1 Tax=Rhodoblastus sp. TaxID=1962975 RepID=UPI002638DC51|nr:ribonuclease T2 [Rhodoblastus sp.]
MKRLLAALLLAFAALSAMAGGPARADDCILDHCADRRSSPDAPAASAPDPAPWRRSSGGGALAGDFDFYVLALSWSPSFCAMGGAARSPAQCASGANPGFVVHGLWPQNDYGYPRQCPGNGFLPFSVLSSLGDLYPDQGLARHEWRQHGLCSGKPPSGYFADVRTARDAIAVPPAFKAPATDLRLSPLDVQRAFFDANPRLRPGMMAVTCRRGLFQEARFCLSKDLRAFVPCPQVAQQGCRSQSVVLPAAR